MMNFLAELNPSYSNNPQQTNLGLAMQLLQQAQPGAQAQPQNMGDMLLRAALMSALNPNSKTNSNTYSMINPNAAAQQGLNNTPQVPNPTTMPTQQAPQNQSLTAQPSIPQSSVAGGDLIQQIKDAAAQAYPDDRVMQQTVLTVAMHESGLQNGIPSGLAQHNNFFGIKQTGTAGTVNMNTREYYGDVPQSVNASFGANNTVQDSVNQFKSLMNKPRYKAVLAATTPQQAFQAMQMAGYATDPRYAALLNNVYNNNVFPLYQA